MTPMGVVESRYIVIHCCTIRIAGAATEQGSPGQHCKVLLQEAYVEGLEVVSPGIAAILDFT